MKKLILITLLSLSFFILGWLARMYTDSSKTQSTLIKPIAEPRPLEKYTIENLVNTQITPGNFQITKTIKEDDQYTAYLFNFEFHPSLSTNSSKSITGQINLPNDSDSSPQKYPILIMLRGYVDQEIYQTGDGTRRAAEFFAKNGFITIAPDFLGYAGSDAEAGNIFKARFQTYVTALSLLRTIEDLPNNSELIRISGDLSLNQIQLTNQLINYSSIFLWGHSNGGQIALTVLEITEKTYPTVLWAPVSKPFPYSILYYTDEAEDRGKLIRSELAKFEKLYDVEQYSLDNYFENIEAPLQIHQGTNDDAVPESWSDKLVETLKNLKKDVTYYKYPGANHNLVPAWNNAIARDLSFFEKFL